MPYFLHAQVGSAHAGEPIGRRRPAGRRGQSLRGFTALLGCPSVLRGRRHPGRGGRTTRHQPRHRQQVAVRGQAAGHRPHRGGATRRSAHRRPGRPAGPRTQHHVGLPQRAAPDPHLWSLRRRRHGTRSRTGGGEGARRGRAVAGRRASGVVGAHGVRGRPVRADPVARRRGRPDRRRQRPARSGTRPTRSPASSPTASAAGRTTSSPPACPASSCTSRC